MPTYSYKCKACGITVDHTLPTPYPTLPCSCGSTLHRSYSFSIAPSFQEHYNHSLGMFTPNRRVFNDAFKIASESAYDYTGIEHDFRPHDPMDYSAFGLTDTDVQESREYHARLAVDGSVVKGSSPFKSSTPSTPESSSEAL